MKISIITVSLNNVLTIAETIESVLAQKNAEVEHLIIDGNSDDGTVEKIASYANRIAAWVSEPDSGIYDAMNKGLAMASGDIVGFLNADDFYADNGVLAKVAATFSDSNVDACYSDLVYVSPDDKSKIVRYWRSSPYRVGLFAQGWCPPHPTFFVRRKIYEQFGGFDLGYSIGNDVEIMMRLLARYGIRTVYIPGITVKMRAGGISNQSFSNIFRQNVEIIRAARNNDIPINPFLFIVAKIVSRLKQFVNKPSQVRL